MHNGFVESFNGRMRDELLNETLFMSLAHARVEIAAWPMTTTASDRTHHWDTKHRRRSPPNWISNDLLHYALRAPLRSPLLQPRSCATKWLGSNTSWRKAGGRVTAWERPHNAKVPPDALFDRTVFAIILLRTDREGQILLDAVLYRPVKRPKSCSVA